ncbi:MAG: segregation/condensation protein A [Moraxellaceae bacterium]|nr:MAG: segregation/condensation protein A [Moraxellaceae bacterium]
MSETEIEEFVLTEENSAKIDSAAKVIPELQGPPQQAEMPFAVVQGQPLTTIPQDLYIPPDALEIFLEAFEGPFDFLLYLIKRQNIDILDIQVAEITRQYMEYINLMKACQFDLAAEYLVMAAMLGEIKSRSLLPRQELIEEEEEDPRAELIRRLQEYERIKRAAEDLGELPRVGRDVFPIEVKGPDMVREVRFPDVELKDVLFALKDVLHRTKMFESHHVQREKLSTRERMSCVLASLNSTTFVTFESLFDYEQGRLGIIVTFLAILELVKESLVELVQNEPFAPIHVRASAS